MGRRTYLALSSRRSFFLASFCFFSFSFWYLARRAALAALSVDGSMGRPILILGSSDEVEEDMSARLSAGVGGVWGGDRLGGESANQRRVGLGGKTTSKRRCQSVWWAGAPAR